MFEKTLVLAAGLFCVNTLQAGTPACLPDELFVERIDGPVLVEGRSLGERSAAWNPANEEFLLIWRELDPAALKGQRFGLDFNPVDSLPVTLEASQPINPIVSFNGLAGRYAIAWQNQAAIGDFNSLIARVFQPDLTAVAPAAQLSGSGGGLEPWISPAGGGFVASGRGPIQAYGLLPNGTPGNSSGSLPSTIAAPNGSVAHNTSNGEFLVTWRDQSNERLVAALLDSALNVSLPEFVISETFPASGRAANAHWRNDQGRYLVLFEGFQSDAILLRGVSAAGIPATQEIELVPDLALNFTEAVRVAWLDPFDGLLTVRVESPVGFSGTAVVRLFDSAGAALAPAIELPTDSADRQVQSMSSPLWIGDRQEVVFIGNLIDTETNESSTAFWRYRIQTCPFLFEDRFEAPALP